MAGDGEGEMRQRGKKLCREEVSVVLAAVATAVVLVQRFVDEHSLLLLLPGNAAAALQSSMQAASSALAKLQMMFALTNPQLHSSSGSEPIQVVEETLRERIQLDVFQSRDDRLWRESFRMSRANFFRLLEALGPVLQREGTTGAIAIPAEKKLGAALYRLAHGATFKVVARRFGIAASSCDKAFYEVCQGLEEKLGHLFDFPTAADRVRGISGGFAVMGMPNCCGVLGCTNFAVEKLSRDMGIEYLDQSRSHSVVMQGVVDSRSRFLDISVGWPGSIPPAAILLKTRFYARVRQSQELLQGSPMELGTGILIPQYVLGGPAYNLQPWLITPFPETSGFQLPVLFNKAHSHAMRPLRRAFGMLKEQWQLLKTKQSVENIELVPFIVAASCVLQNFLIDNGEPMPEVEEAEQHESALVEEASEDVYAESVRSSLAALVGELQAGGLQQQC